MGVEDVDYLQQMLESASAWPIWNADNVGGLSSGVFAQAGQYGKSMRDLALWVALRESDRDRIKELLGSDWASDRQYRVDPLPDRISHSFADLLFGEDPTFTAADTGDQENLDGLIEENDLPSELRRWAADCSSEGEVWWRIYVNKEISPDWPIVEGMSRLDTIPYWRGRRLAAVAFFTDIYTQQVQVENAHETEMWRYIQIHTDGMMRNLLYRGSWSGLGTRMDLDARPETEGLEEEWEHKLSMLAGRIPNKLGRDWRLGISDYQGIKDIILDLNEARTIAAENARVAAKRRMLIPVAALDEQARADLGADVIPIENLDEDLENVGKANGPYAVLEYNYQAIPLIEHMGDLVSTALSRVGLAEQMVNSGGRTPSSQAVSGTALRTQLIPTTLAASGKARYWDDGVPKMLLLMMQVASMPPEQGGLGQSFSNLDEKPGMERSSVLPEDPMEEVNRLVTAVAGEVMSVETAVTELNTDREESWIKDEIKRIQEDRSIFGINAPKPGAGDGSGGGGDGPPSGAGGAFAQGDGQGDGAPADQQPELVAGGVS